MALQLANVTLYKNDLAFYEFVAPFASSAAAAATTTPVVGGSNTTFRTKLDIPLKSKNLIVDTLSVRSPGLVLVSYDSELHESIKARDNQEDTFNFKSDSFADFLKSCAGAPIEFSTNAAGGNGEGSRAHVELVSGTVYLHSHHLLKYHAHSITTHPHTSRNNIHCGGSSSPCVCRS